MVSEAEQADLVLVVCSSLQGHTTDFLAHKPAARSLGGAALGTVILGPHQTALDGAATLRLFAEPETALGLLLATLRVCPARPQPDPLLHAARVSSEYSSTENYHKLISPNPILCTDHSVEVPYDRCGFRSASRTILLDLSAGQRVRLHPQHNCPGSRQRKLSHITRPDAALEERARALSAAQRSRQVSFIAIL